MSMKYEANPVIVDAFVITHVDRTKLYANIGMTDADQGGQPCASCICEDGKIRLAGPEMVARYFPSPGDYWVIQEDGYEYLNPKAVFERKYHALQPA